MKMEEKVKAIKASSRVIAVIMKICCIAMIVEMCICVSGLIFLAATGGETSLITSGGLKILAVDESVTTAAGAAALCISALIIGAFLFVIFFLTFRMFKEISASGTPFNTKYVRTIKTLGVLTVVLSFVGNIVDSSAAAYAGMTTFGMSTGSTGIVFGVIVFCLAYIFDYGCMLQRQSDETL